MKRKPLALAAVLLGSMLANSCSANGPVFSPSSLVSSSLSSGRSLESSVVSSSSAQSSYDTNAYEGAKRQLSSEVIDDNVASINEQAINQGLYKPMFELTHYNVTNVVYPYVVNRQQYYVLDSSKLLVLDKPITSDDHASMTSRNFTNKVDAVSYLKGLGYETKNEVTLRYAPFFDDMPITEDIDAKSFLSRKLFVADEYGTLQDDAASLSQINEKGFVLTLKEGVSWRDVNGNVARALNADDVLNGYEEALDHGLFKDVYKASDNTIVITAKEAIGLEKAKWAIAVSYGSPKPSSDESLFLADEFTMNVLEDGYQFVKDGFTLNLRKNGAGVEFDLVDAYSGGDSSYFVKDRINYGLRTYGFTLNPAQGNEAYRTAVNNEHFRKAVLALLSHENIKTLTHHPYVSNGSYDGVSDSFSCTWQSGHDFPSVILQEGVDEAASQFALAEEEGLPEGTIELYVGDPSYRDEKVELLQSLANEAFGDRVKISAKVYQDEQYYYSTSTGYPYQRGSRTFYSEIELDGFYYQTAADYLRGALSPLK